MKVVGDRLERAYLQAAAHREAFAGNVTSIAMMAKVAENAGADALSVANTFVAMAIDAETRKPRIANVTAGLSGPAIKPIALRMVFDAARAVKIPVIGIGASPLTAADIGRSKFVLAGATAVQGVGTASYWDPLEPRKKSWTN